MSELNTRTIKSRTDVAPTLSPAFISSAALLCKLAFAALLTAFGLRAQGETAINPPLPSQDLDGRTVEEAYGGVVVGQTVTVAGQDFYQYFVALWRDKPSNEKYSITVRERPSARLGNLVWVEYERRTLFQAILPVSRSQIRPVSEQAVEIAWQRMMELEIERQLFNDADLAKDEL